MLLSKAYGVKPQSDVSLLRMPQRRIGETSVSVNTPMTLLTPKALDNSVDNSYLNWITITNYLIVTVT